MSTAADNDEVWIPTVEDTKASTRTLTLADVDRFVAHTRTEGARAALSGWADFLESWDPERGRTPAARIRHYRDTEYPDPHPTPEETP